MKSPFSVQKILLKNLNLKFILILIATSIGISTTLFAQNTKLIKPSWWFGVAGGLNTNLYYGTAREINSELTIYANFNDRVGYGIFALPMMEYHRPNARLGLMLYSGYESRENTFNRALTAKLAYLTIEPSIRLNLFKSSLYVYSGPRLAIPVNSDYTYNSPEIAGAFSYMKKSVISMQVGAGFDFSVTGEKSKTQFIVAPFVAYHPHFGQNPRTVEDWNLTTWRTGFAFKFGNAHKLSSAKPGNNAKEQSQINKIQRQDQVEDKIELTDPDHFAYTKSAWWFGVAGGLNTNLYYGNAQEINSELTISARFNDRVGYGIFALPMVEYHRPNARFGFMLYTGYESRESTFNRALTAKLAYLTVEPSIRLNLFKSPLYIYSGPRLAFPVNNNYTYNSPEVAGAFSYMKKSVISMQFGAGFDYSVTGEKRKTQIIVAPFVAYHPHFGQNPRTIEDWNVTTWRTGIVFKFGRGHSIPVPDHVVAPIVIPDESEVALLPVNKQPASENTGLIGNMYFDLKVKENDKNLGSIKTDTPTGIRSINKTDQPTIENNILNKMGNYLKNNPFAQLSLMGTSVQDKTDGKEMAESVSNYLKDVYGVSSSSILTKGRKVKIGHDIYSGNKDELLLLEDGKRKVLIKSQDLGLTKVISDFDPRPKAKRLFVINEAIPENQIVLSTENAREPLSTWSLKLTDEKGVVQNFGPFFKDFVKIPTQLVLGNRAEAYFDFLISGQSKNLITISKDTTLHIARWTAPQHEKNYRFSVTYAFNNPKAIHIFEKYLIDVVLPKIPENGRVIVHGHSDNIETSDYYLKTSLVKENDVKRILGEALAKSGRYNVNFEMHGFGEDITISPFTKVPFEKKLLWRTVIIDIANSEE